MFFVSGFLLDTRSETQVSVEIFFETLI